MKSPLETYKEVAKEFGVTEAENLELVGRLGFVREQSIQKKHIINRLLVDISSKRIELAQAKDDHTKAAFNKSINDFENELRQMINSIKLDNMLIKELEDEIGAE